MAILGIETSCDETSVGIVSLGTSDESGTIISNLVHSQTADHSPFGGVVPELAARKHIERLDGMIQASLSEANLSFPDIDGIAVTTGPGLAGGLIVGAMTARTISRVHHKPLWTINHLEGHALSGRLSHGISFPYLACLLSGGHSQIILVKSVGDYERWSTTLDDALGEAFDKVAKLLGLPYPGGPEVEKMAMGGDGTKYDFPRPLSNNKQVLDMSFSGLKTSVRKSYEDSDKSTTAIKDICASFQVAVSDVLQDRARRGIEKFETEFSKKSSLVICGGVGSNEFIRTKLLEVTQSKQWDFVAPPSYLCSDNGAMIAWAGLERQRANIPPSDDGIHPRWPLDSISPSKVGSGKKGAKV